MDLGDLAGYSLRRQLGSGPSGTVWQVRDRATGRNVVLKHIPLDTVPDPRRLREDLSLLSRLRHPHLAYLREYHETATGWVLITQHLVAGTLAALLTRRGPLSRGELVTLLAPLAEAVAHLHDAGLTHGSITPTNIMFDADGRPILTDATLHPSTTTADIQSLPTVTQAVAADPSPFTPRLLTTTPLQALPNHLLALSPPTPIDLAMPLDPLPPPTPGPPDGTPPTPRPPASAGSTPGPAEVAASTPGPAEVAASTLSPAERIGSTLSPADGTTPTPGPAEVAGSAPGSAEFATSTPSRATGTTPTPGPVGGAASTPDPVGSVTPTPGPVDGATPTPGLVGGAVAGPGSTGGLAAASGAGFVSGPTSARTSSDSTGVPRPPAHATSPSAAWGLPAGEVPAEWLAHPTAPRSAGGGDSPAGRHVEATPSEDALPGAPVVPTAGSADGTNGEPADPSADSSGGQSPDPRAADGQSGGTSRADRLSPESSAPPSGPPASGSGFRRGRPANPTDSADDDDVPTVSRTPLAPPPSNPPEALPTPSPPSQYADSAPAPTAKPRAKPARPTRRTKSPRGRATRITRSASGTEILHNNHTPNNRHPFAGGLPLAGHTSDRTNPPSGSRPLGDGEPFDSTGQSAATNPPERSEPWDGSAPSLGHNPPGRAEPWGGSGSSVSHNPLGGGGLEPLDGTPLDGGGLLDASSPLVGTSSPGDAEPFGGSYLWGRGETPANGAAPESTDAFSGRYAFGGYVYGRANASPPSEPFHGNDAPGVRDMSSGAYVPDTSGTFAGYGVGRDEAAAGGSGAADTSDADGPGDLPPPVGVRDGYTVGGDYLLRRSGAVGGGDATGDSDGSEIVGASGCYRFGPGDEPAGRVASRADGVDAGSGFARYAFHRGGAFDDGNVPGDGQPANGGRVGDGGYVFRRGGAIGGGNGPDGGKPVDRDWVGDGGNVFRRGGASGGDTSSGGRPADGGRVGDGDYVFRRGGAFGGGDAPGGGERVDGGWVGDGGYVFRRGGAFGGGDASGDSPYSEGTLRRGGGLRRGGTRGGGTRGGGLRGGDLRGGGRRGGGFRRRDGRRGRIGRGDGWLRGAARDRFGEWGSGAGWGSRAAAVRELVARALQRPAYGVLGAAALGAVVVLVFGIAVVRTLDGSATQAPAAGRSGTPQSTVPQSEATATQPSEGTPTQPSGGLTTQPSAGVTVRPSGGTSARPSVGTSARPSVGATRSGSVGESSRGQPAVGGAELMRWVRILQALDVQRARAFWTLELGALDGVYVRGSSAWVADRALLSAYRRQNVRVRGLRMAIADGAIIRRTPTSVTLRITDHLAAGQVVDVSGTTTALPPGRPTTRLVTLTTKSSAPTPAQPEAWRISTITRA